jgi:hypothetical protein
MELRVAQLELERQRLEEEKQNNLRLRDFEEKKFAAEQSRSQWVQLSTQLSVAIPVLTLLLAGLIAYLSDNAKRAADQQRQIYETHRSFIHRQLADFYYPVSVRLQQDDDIWHLAFPKKTDPSALKALLNQHSQFSLYVQKQMLIPNHEQVLQIIANHGDLLENGFENQNSRQAHCLALEGHQPVSRARGSL